MAQKRWSELCLPAACDGHLSSTLVRSLDGFGKARTEGFTSEAATLIEIPLSDIARSRSRELRKLREFTQCAFDDLARLRERHVGDDHDVRGALIRRKMLGSVLRNL